MQIPISSLTLECKIEEMIRKGGACLSDLFLVFGHIKDEGEFEKVLPEKMVEDLKKNLRRFHPELFYKIDCKKIKVFFVKDNVKALILDHRKFPYPKPSKVSKRPFEEVNERPSNIILPYGNPN